MTATVRTERTMSSMRSTLRSVPKCLTTWSLALSKARSMVALSMSSGVDSGSVPSRRPAALTTTLAALASARRTSITRAEPGTV